MRYWFLILISFHLLSSYAVQEQCSTHQFCQIGQTCECSIPAVSAYNRYYYFDFSALEQGKHYQCDFNSSPLALSIVLDQSSFPLGINYQCLGKCPSFPLVLTLDTSHMQESKSTFRIKYFVPGSDYPVNVSAKCYLINE